MVTTFELLCKSPLDSVRLQHCMADNLKIALQITTTQQLQAAALHGGQR